MKHAAGVIVVTNSKKVLLLKRGPTAPWMPNKWGLPGGKVEEGESSVEAASRELQEEAGLIVNPSDLKFLTAKTEGNVFFVYFVAHEDVVDAPHNGRVKLNYEHTQAVFASKDELSKYDLVPRTKEVISEALMARNRDNPQYREGRDRTGRVCLQFFNDDGSPYMTELGHKFCYSTEKAEEILRKLNKKDAKKPGAPPRQESAPPPHQESDRPPRQESDRPPRHSRHHSSRPVEPWEYGPPPSWQEDAPPFEETYYGFEEEEVPEDYTSARASSRQTSHERDDDDVIGGIG